MRIELADRAILDLIAQRRDAIVSRAVAWCAIASGSGDPAGLERMRAALERALAALPGEIETIALTPPPSIGGDGRPRWAPGGAALRLTVRPEAPVQVVLTGHYDTVYPPGSPFTAVVERGDGALNGPGIADMKGGISVMLAALEAVEAHPLAHRLGYRLLLSPDEETGSPGSAPLLAEIAQGAQLGLTYEPALADGTLAGARKGSGNFHVVVTGVAAHAGRDFAAGRNAVAAAARLAAALDGLNGARDGVTVNVARIDGGGALNVVPDNAVLRFNVRFPDAASMEWARERIDALIAAAARPGLSLALHGGFGRPAKAMNAAQEMLFGKVRAIGALLGQPIAWRDSGGVCEGNNLFAAGLPSIDTLGVRGGDIHSEAEFAWPDSFAERAQLSALILAKLASGEFDGAALRAMMPAA